MAKIKESADTAGSVLYSVSELGQDLGVSARTIRFYEDKGLIAPRRVGNNRVYTLRGPARMILILRGKRLGFTLREIKEYLDLYDADPTHAKTGAPAAQGRAQPNSAAGRSARGAQPDPRRASRSASASPERAGNTGERRTARDCLNRRLTQMGRTGRRTGPDATGVKV